MNAPSKDIIEMLEAYGDSSGFTPDLTLGTNLFQNQEPSSPAICVTVYDTSGMPDYLGLDTVGYEYPSIQVRVRHTKQSTGWALISAIKDALHGRNHETWNGTLYTVIYCTSGPALLDWDDNGRVHFVCNFNLQRRPA